MPVRHRINPRPQSTPAEPRLSTGGRREIPADLLRVASRRLGVMALIAAVLWILGTVLGRIAFYAFNPGAPGITTVHVPDAIAIVSALLSLALCAYTRRSTRDPGFILNLGLVHLVLTGLGIGVIMHWYPIARGVPIQPMISWMGACVLMYAAILPTPPWKMFAVGLLAVTMTPVGMLLAKANGDWDFGPWGYAFLMHYPDFLLVGVAAVISHVVTQLGQQVTRAREMGSYQLGELLGRGGMGEVYTATHRLLARPAAIKLIRPEMLRGANGESAQIAVKRFRREAEVAANLRSPHTVELYDFGVTEDETLYFVMELLDGLDLESLVRQYGPLPAGRVVHILRQVCESLEEAHARGLVHRDIKPANIHVGRLGLRHDFVKVLDFGLVKPVATAKRPDGEQQLSLATAGGLTPGTPAYMAPEVSVGDAADGRADLYAVGCVAYYLLTGRLVFEAENAVRLIVMHLQDAPEPPSQHAPHPVPPALDALVLACLAKEPRGRPGSAAELGRALAASGAESWGEDEAAAWWRTHRPSTVASAITTSSALLSPALPVPEMPGV